MPGGIELRLLRIPYIYDFDDAFFLKYRHKRFRRVSFLLKDKFEPVISRAAAVLAGNHYLADYANQLNPATTCLPTVVDTDRYVRLSGERDDIFTVGWIGSPSTSVYLSALALPLAQLGREGPVRFVVVGGRCEAIDGVEVVNLPWEEATEVSLINTFDVGVMPLFDDEWARGKCALKLIQYMACGVPAVASPVGANLDVINEFMRPVSQRFRRLARRTAPVERRQSAAARYGRCRTPTHRAILFTSDRSTRHDQRHQNSGSNEIMSRHMLEWGCGPTLSQKSAFICEVATNE